MYKSVLLSLTSLTSVVCEVLPRDSGCNVLLRVPACSVRSYLVYKRDLLSFTSCKSVFCEVLPGVRARSVKSYLCTSVVCEVLPLYECVL